MDGVIDPEVLADVSARFAAIRQRVDAACRRVGRDPGQVTLIGACKRQPLARIAAAVCAGLGELGENYVQEARAKQDELAALLARHFGASHAPTPRWRLIGHLQRNKARHAVQIFQAIDTVDSLSLARELGRRAASHDLQLDACLQVNLSGEASKSGVVSEALPELLAGCRPLEHLRVVGLMTMPAPGPTPEASRNDFARLRALRDTLRRAPGGERLQQLSMGMSQDFEVAVEEGASLIRIGTALFGERETGGANEGMR